MKDRIRQLMELSHLSQQDFAARLGISPASLSSIFTGRSNPTTNHINAVHRAFPDVNINWLIFGEGEMFTPADDETSTTTDQEDTALPGSHLSEGAPSSVTPHQSSSSIPAQQQQKLDARKERMRDLFDFSKPLNPFSSQGNASEFGSFDNSARRIKEIRVFFDDGTYEIFVPSR